MPMKVSQNLSLKHLRAFVELATERNFTRAAKNCYLSQPAFSTLIRNLEAQAGAALFNRNTRNVDLTAEGRVFEARIMPLLEEFEAAFGDIRDHVERRRGRLSIAALPTIAGGPLSPVLAHFTKHHPGIILTLYDVRANDCLDLVRGHRADFGLAAAISPGPDLVSEPLMSDKIHLICRDDHPLAGRSQLTLDDVLPLPMICFDHSSSVRQHVDAAFYPHQARTVMEVRQLMTAAGLVLAGMGVTLVPTMAIFQFQSPSLVAIPVSLPTKDRSICLIRRCDSADSVAAATFIDLLRQMWEMNPTSK